MTSWQGSNLISLVPVVSAAVLNVGALGFS